MSPAFIFCEEVNGCSGLWLNIALSMKNATARNLADNTSQPFHFPILFIFFYKEILKARKLGCSSSHCSFNFRPKNVEPVQGVRRRKIFSNTAGVLNWPSFSISIDFPTVYIDFLNILSKVGTYVTPKGSSSDHDMLLDQLKRLRENYLLFWYTLCPACFIDLHNQEYDHRVTFNNCNILSVIRLFVCFTQKSV